MTEFLSTAFTLFLIANPIGNTPAILAVVRSYSFNDQKRIIFRESIIALGLALFFQFFGEVFLNLLEIKTWAVGYCGGTLLLLVAFNMIFSKTQDTDIPPPASQEPLIVPIATPIITGPGLMTMIMLFSSQEPNSLKMSLEIIFAWIGVMAAMVSGPYLQKILKRRGMIALEQLMGMLLVFMSVDMLVNATAEFIKRFS